MKNIIELSGCATFEQINEASKRLGELLGSKVGIDADLYEDVEDAISDALVDAENLDFIDSYKKAVELRSSAIEQEINERIFVKEIEMLTDAWPSVLDMIVEQYSADDEDAINQGFNDWTDSLCKDGEISDYTYDNVTQDDL
jgi:hypothetical protein